LVKCYSPKHVVSTADGNRLVVACEGLADDDIADPEGSVTVVDTSSDDANEWRVFSVGFTDFDDSDGHPVKHLPAGIYRPRPESPFSVNAEPEYVTLDDDGHFAYISLQENNGVAIVDLRRLEMVSVLSFGAHDFGFSGLDASDRDGGVHIERYTNLYGLRQPDGVAHYRSSGGGQYLLTANEGNAKYYDSVRVGDVELDDDAFGDDHHLQDDDHLGRLQVLSGAGSEYGQNAHGEVDRLYTFGSRDWTAWRIQTGSETDAECPCDSPSSLRLVFSSLDDMEQVTASQLGDDGFNSDLFSPSGDSRSDDKGPEPESIVVGQCSNGDSYAFIGLERAGGVMVYDITDIDDGEVTFVEFLNSRDFSVHYAEGSRPPESAGNVEPETMVFVPDTDDSEEALLVVGYKTSASIAVYSFNCGCHRQYEVDSNTQTAPIPSATDDAHGATADECHQQSPCLHVTMDEVSMHHDHSHSATTVAANRRRLGDQDEVDTLYRVCLSMALSNPYCAKSDAHFLYAASLHEEEVADPDALALWPDGTTKCQYAHCSGSVSFAVRDGDGCSASDPLTGQTLGAVDGVECRASGQESCHWTVPTPQCAPEVSAVNAQLDDDPLQIDGDEASSCSAQSECVHVELTAADDAAEADTYSICMWWLHDDDTHCAKGEGDVFALSATGSHIEDESVSWRSGMDHAICQSVSCGAEAVFALKDEGSCSESVAFEGSLDAVEGVSCSGNEAYDVEGSCKWTVPAPECHVEVVVDDGASELLEDNDYQYGNDEQQSENTWHTITNRGGHFYESTVFYVLLAISALTCVSVVGCVIKLSKGTVSANELGLHEEPLEPADWDPEQIAE